MLETDFFAPDFDAVTSPMVDDFDASGLAPFKGEFSGERCFIIGNGPSLNRTEAALLADEFTFGVNGVFYLTEQSGFAPTFYVVEDNHVFEDNLERIIAVEALRKFFPAKYRSIVPAGPTTHLLQTDWQWYWGSSPYHEEPRFSLDAADIVYAGQTVTYINLQLAAFLGFSDIYLVGVDMDYVVPDDAPVEGKSITSTGADTNHFHPDYFGAGKKWHFPRLDRVALSMGHARAVAEEHGFRIWNATIGGKLEAFPRVDFYSLFEGAFEVDEPNRADHYALTTFLRSPSWADRSLRLVAHRGRCSDAVLRLLDRESLRLNAPLSDLVDADLDAQTVVVTTLGDDTSLDAPAAVIKLDAQPAAARAELTEALGTGRPFAWSRNVLEYNAAATFLTQPRLSAEALSKSGAARSGELEDLFALDRGNVPVSFDLTVVDGPDLLARALEAGHTIAHLGGYLFVQSRFGASAPPDHVPSASAPCNPGDES